MSKDTPRPQSGRKNLIGNKHKVSSNSTRRTTDDVWIGYQPDPYPSILSESIILDDKLLFKNTETHFKYVIQHLARRSSHKLMSTNVLRYDNERKMIMEFGNKLYCSNKYAMLLKPHIYMVLLYAYYAVHLIEQYWDRLTFKHIKYYFAGRLYKVAEALFFDITSRDIILDGVNISSEIRRAFMGLDVCDDNDNM